MSTESFDNPDRWTTEELRGICTWLPYPWGAVPDMPWPEADIESQVKLAMLRNYLRAEVAKVRAAEQPKVPA